MSFELVLGVFAYTMTSVFGFDFPHEIEDKFSMTFKGGRPPQKT